MYNQLYDVFRLYVDDVSYNKKGPIRRVIMKKKILTILCLALLASPIISVSAKTTSNDVAEAIKMYKAGNYTGCYQKLNKVVKKDTGNALAYYYLAMSAAQSGKDTEAITNYSKVIALTSANSNLNRYATKGRTCLEDPEKCENTSIYSSLEEAFILNRKGPKLTDEVKSEFEKLKIEQMMREMNRSNDIDPNRFKEYKDFSSMNNDTPSNDEIVAALKTLQNAGLGNMFNNNNNYSDLSLLMGGQSGQYNMFNMMNSSSLNPQVIQAMLTSNMASGF